MTAVYPNTVAYPFSAQGGLELADEYLEAQRMRGDATCPAFPR